MVQSHTGLIFDGSIWYSATAGRRFLNLCGGEIKWQICYQLQDRANSEKKHSNFLKLIILEYKFTYLAHCQILRHNFMVTCWLLERTYAYCYMGTPRWRHLCLVSLGFLAEQLHQITQYTLPVPPPSHHWINIDNSLLYLTFDFEGLLWELITHNWGILPIKLWILKAVID